MKSVSGHTPARFNDSDEFSELEQRGLGVTTRKRLK